MAPLQLLQGNRKALEGRDTTIMCRSRLRDWWAAVIEGMKPEEGTGMLGVTANHLSKDERDSSSCSAACRFL